MEQYLVNISEQHSFNVSAVCETRTIRSGSLKLCVRGADCNIETLQISAAVDCLQVEMDGLTQILCPPVIKA